jgi:Ca-activated chloride channel family protein
MHISIQTDRSLLRAAARSTRNLLISLTAPTAAARAERLAVSVALVLDRSGSMDGERKFELAREAVEQALRMLRPEDRFSLVVYDTEVDVLVPATFATPEAKRLGLHRLRQVGPRGSTDLHAGWTTGASQIGDMLSAGAVHRVLLLTDGLANHGVTDRSVLVASAAEHRRAGIATSTFGVGADFDERLLRDISREGDGNFYFIETPAQIPDLLTSELGEAQEVLVRGAVLHVEVPDGAEAEPLNVYRSTHGADARELRVELGDLTSAQELRLVVRIRFPSGAPDDVTSATVRVTDHEGSTLGDVRRCEWRYASHAANDAQPRDRVVDREVARLHASRARAEATEANRRGDFWHARRALERTALRIEDYAGGDVELQVIARELRDDVERFAEQAMSPMQLKMAVYVAESAGKSRGSDGKARRSPGGFP